MPTGLRGPPLAPASLPWFQGEKAKRRKGEKAKSWRKGEKAGEKERKGWRKGEKLAKRRKGWRERAKRLAKKSEKAGEMAKRLAKKRKGWRKGEKAGEKAKRLAKAGEKAKRRESSRRKRGTAGGAAGLAWRTQGSPPARGACLVPLSTPVRAQSRLKTSLSTVETVSQLRQISAQLRDRVSTPQVSTLDCFSTVSRLEASLSAVARHSADAVFDAAGSLSALVS